MRASSDEPHVRQSCRRAGAAGCALRRRTRHNASQSRARTRRLVAKARWLTRGLWTHQQKSQAVHLFATYTFRQRRLRTSRYECQLHARAVSIASDAIEASLQHLWPKLQAPRRYRGEFCSTPAAKAPWRVYSYSSSPPALTPLPHSTAPHQPSRDQSTIAPGIRWPGAAAKPRSPTRPHSSVV
jgi:hypothetical protein